MPPRRAVAKKAATTESTDTVVARVEVNGKPTKGETKKKTPKNAKKMEPEDVVKDEIVLAKKVQPKKTTIAKKSTKKMEQNENNDVNVENASSSVEAKPKRGATKRGAANVKAIEQKDKEEEKIEPLNGANENGKLSVRGKKKAEELTTASPKVTKKAAEKIKPKKAEPEPTVDEVEAGPSKVMKKSTKAKTVKQSTKIKNEEVENETVDDVPETKRAKRGATKTASTQQTSIENDETTKSKAKKVSGKSTKSAKRNEPLDVIENVAQNNDGDSTKGRKRKATGKADAAKAPVKETKDTGDVVDGALGSKSNDQAKKRKAEAKPADSTTQEPDDELVTKRKKQSKSEQKVDSTKTKQNTTATDYSKVNFESEKEFSLKIVSWNVAGLRAIIAKNGFEYFDYEKPDIICLQEIKCLEDEVPEAAKLKGYHPYWCSTPGGRGGVAILSKSMPYNVDKNIGDEEMDEEGRIITAEYSKFFLVCVYVPNAGRKLVNLDRRLRWNTMFEGHVNKLKSRKPVIICGDMNVAHEEIDLANPKTNRKNAGFSDEERAGMTQLLQHGFIDTFRDLYPNRDKAYTFWTYMGNARRKNVGWRLDYSIISENLKSKVVDSLIRDQIFGSDHCPIVLLLQI